MNPHNVTVNPPMSTDSLAAAFYEQAYVILKQLLAPDVRREVHMAVDGLVNNLIDLLLESGTIEGDSS